MEILLALAAAVAYGVSDFAGGVLTRGRTSSWSSCCPSSSASPCCWWSWRCEGTPSRGRGGLGAAAGLAGVVDTSLLYQGLAIGRMSVVAEP